MILKYEKKYSKGSLAARNAVSCLTSAKCVAPLAFHKADQKAQVSSERVKEAHVALNRAKEGMCHANQCLEELGAKYEALETR